jgi:hypothetical protein
VWVTLNINNNLDYINLDQRCNALSLRPFCCYILFAEKKTSSASKLQTTTIKHATTNITSPIPIFYIYGNDQQFMKSYYSDSDQLTDDQDIPTLGEQEKMSSLFESITLYF